MISNEERHWVMENIAKYIAKYLGITYYQKYNCIYKFPKKWICTIYLGAGEDIEIITVEEEKYMLNQAFSCSRWNGRKLIFKNSMR